MPVLWLLINLSYNQRSRLTDRKLLALWIVPAGVLALVLTNDWHGLFWTHIAPVSPEPGALLVYEFGVGMWVHMAYSYALMISGTILLIFTSVRTYRLYMGQTATLVLGALVPYAGNIVYFLWLNQYAAFDPTSIAVAITGLIYAWSMFRYQLLDLVPVARDTVVANMKDAVVVIDDRDRIIDLNPAAKQLLATPGSPGQSVAATFEDWPELLTCLPRLGEEPVEIRQDRKEGVRYFDAHVSPLVDGNGMRTGGILILRDITGRKLNESALDETRRNLRTLFDTVDDLIFVTDHEGKVLEVNNTLARRLGYRKGDVIENDLHNLDRPDCCDGALARSREAGPGNLTTRTGDVIKVETRLARGLWGGRPAVFGVSRDVTDLIRQQAELTRANVALLGEIEERRSAEKQIEVSLHEKDVLLKEVHHRVKNNLQIITSLLNLQKAYESSEEVSTAIAESQNRIMSMALIHEKLYESRDLSRIDFADYVRSLTAYLTRAYAVGPNIRIEVEIGDIALGADMAITCGLIISELVSNSARYGFPGEKSGTIRISLTRTGDTYALTVTDDGVGLPAHFDFGQASSPGFRLVNRLVSQLEGTIEIDGSAGTMFTIAFQEKAQAGRPPPPGTRDRMETAGNDTGTSPAGN